MELELKELGQTLAVGGLAVFGITHLIGLCRAQWVPQLPPVSGNGSSLHHSGMIVVMVLASGIVIEDISENVANRAQGMPFSVFNWILDSKQELRFRSLFDINEQSDGIIVHGKPIYQDLVASVEFIQCDQLGSKNINSLMNIAGDGKNRILLKEEYGDLRNSPQSLKLTVDAVFYVAKNRVYRDELYNKELREIEGRIRFVRATIFLCYTFLLLYLFLFLICWERRIATWLDVLRREQWQALGIALLAVLFIWLLRFSYDTSSTNYNRRVFGYYRSLLTAN